MPDPDVTSVPRVGIGALLRQLEPQFPGLTASKVRFLEDQGLVHPHRTASGYRKYSAEDIERLETVLRLQRERFLPLRVIRQRLDSGEDPAAGTDIAREPEDRAETGGEPAPTAVSSAAGGQALAHPVRATGRRYTLRELAARTGTDVGLVRELLNHGLVVERDGHFDDYALAVVSAAGTLRTYGIEPRHVRGLRGAAERTVGLVEGAVAPLVSRKDAESRHQAPQRAREIASLCLSVIAALTNAQLHESHPAPAPRAEGRHTP